MYFILRWYYKIRQIQLNRKAAQIRKRLIKVCYESGQDGEWVAAFMDEIREQQIAEYVERLKQEGHDDMTIQRFIKGCELPH
jgi:hypothetical protein